MRRAVCCGLGDDQDTKLNGLHTGLQLEVGLGRKRLLTGQSQTANVGYNTTEFIIKVLQPQIDTAAIGMFGRNGDGLDGTGVGVGRGGGRAALNGMRRVTHDMSVRREQEINNLKPAAPLNCI
jgi:hypothetical protein